MLWVTDANHMLAWNKLRMSHRKRINITGPTEFDIHNAKRGKMNKIDKWARACESRVGSDVCNICDKR